MRRTIPCSALVFAALLIGCGKNSSSAPDAGPAGVINQLQVVTTSDAYGGASFGNAGVYEVVSGVVHGAVNPRHPANAGIVDLNLAPVDSNGMVDYTTDFLILRPKVAANAKRIVFYDVVNRGNNLATNFINNGSAGFAAGKQGDGLLLRLGYTLVFSGWQGSIAQTGHGDTMAIGTAFPVAHNADGTSITGMSREEVVFDNSTATTFALTYPAANPADQASVNFNYRQTWDTSQGNPPGAETWSSPSTPIPPSSWSYSATAGGAADPSHVTFTRPSGSGNSAIYSFVYTAKDPIVMGIGFAAVRDLVSFLRNDSADAQGTPNPLNDLKTAPCAVANCAASSTNFDFAIMEGISQSGRFARDFLWQGFNDDGTGHKVFDGLYPIIAGSRKTWTNFRFAQPGRFSRQHEDHFQRNDQFPFGYGVITDPVSGATDGIFKKCLVTSTCPVVMHVDGGYESWGARDLLVSTDGQGHDVTLPDNVRLYVIPGVNHGGGAGVGTQSQPTLCTYLSSPINERQTIRALVPAMEAWLTTGTAPPASQWPSVSAGTAVAPTNQTAVNFPAIPNVVFGGNLYNQLFVTDYTNAIPVADTTKPYTILVSKTDADGNDVAGVRVPDVVAPIATFQSWNQRAANYAPGDQCNTYGSMFPFAPTQAARTGVGDPRLSLAERYSSHTDYVNKVTAAANALVSQKLLLQEDVAFYVNAAQAASVP